ncbi:recombination protein U [Clostridium acetobutylicum]|uniref:Uncharacterized protein n=1 Tax=Clostridium acetobutylicum (strain ATCC 824 / DSM 792 / JCM 1419 / IAM 19013 / LMG 5710 / NBRC 13948 / NRRL B-527 / VKM B-1787 / 2291 / W) TaxID=272562 RepID=Q97JP9_CLOAB|nr:MULTISPECIES: hypothetical protein [Clostridium]AAK79196.1 Hypothetical protein CA_C1224 [Clostridium acetobutylicum ATCC 824]ADZ20275.1 Conserved hypothetical protein [Clostridium acetobutylicum EA 2018]AEI31725.1 hypothetical protein SMB_G1245 [Clostridium acetobutylicum DSM 1731]AWV81553.1 hypothetical protein DK921_15930 [Clostridium acetobutylicum]MBC2393193.1 hypothetical protein [Clostridium acetobutylicum]
MAINTGKRFEEDFKKSIPEKYCVIRLKDSASSWNGGTSSRFTINNPCDYIVFANKWLHLVELKSHKGASFPIAPKYKEKKRMKKIKINRKQWYKIAQVMHSFKFLNIEKYIPKKVSNYGVIKPNQINDLIKYHKKENVNGIFIFNLSEKDRTYCVDCREVKQAIDENKKSLSMEWLNLHGILLNQEKKKTRWKYDLSPMFD